MNDAELLDRVDAYLDVVQRDASDPEPVGPFTLFVSRAPYPLYARPRREDPMAVTPADLDALSTRCATVGMPLAVEWVEEVSPSVAPVVRAAGLAVQRYPLLVLTPDRFTPPPPAPGVTIVAATTAAELATARAVAHVGFGHGGTEVGDAGTAERDASAAGSDPDQLAFFVDDATAGRTLTLAAAVEAVDAEPGGVVASALAKPVAGAAEVMGVATLPVFRRRGLAAQVTSALVEAVFAEGVDLALLSADSDAVARVYERLGFRRIGHTGQAEREG